MRLFRVRFTIRRLMGLVLAFALLLATLRFVISALPRVRQWRQLAAEEERLSKAYRREAVRCRTCVQVVPCSASDYVGVGSAVRTLRKSDIEMGLIMDRQLDRLMDLAPPPHVPRHAGSPTDWEQVESIIGTRLPGDYKDLINTYGRGEFCDQIWVLSPFSPKPNDLVSQIGPMLEGYRYGLEELPEQCPFRAFPSRAVCSPSEAT